VYDLSQVVDDNRLDGVPETEPIPVKMKSSSYNELIFLILKVFNFNGF